MKNPDTDPTKVLHQAKPAERAEREAEAAARAGEQALRQAEAAQRAAIRAMEEAEKASEPTPRTSGWPEPKLPPLRTPFRT